MYITYVLHCDYYNKLYLGTQCCNLPRAATPNCRQKSEKVTNFCIKSEKSDKNFLKSDKKSENFFQNVNEKDNYKSIVVFICTVHIFILDVHDLALLK